MPPSRIVFCAYDRPGYVSGGPNTWLRRLLPDLRGAGFEIHPLIIHGGNEQECPLIEALRAQGFPLRCLSGDMVPYCDDQVRWLLTQAREIAPHTFVANLVTPAFYATHWLRRAGIPVVGVFHSDACFYDAVLKRFVCGRAEDAFHAVVAVSELLESTVANSTPHGTKLVRIPCGAPLPKEITTLQASTTGPLKLVYLGRIAHEAKRILDLARACDLAVREIGQVEATIYGSGPEEEELRDRIAQENLAVRFAGEVAPEEVLGTLRDHSVFVLLSDYEGLPIALIEAMGCGLVPVCLAERSGIAEVVKDGVNGLIVTDRGESFVAAIRRLHEDRGLFKRLSQAARQTVAEEYASAINHRRWTDLLGELSANVSPCPVHVPWHPHLPLPSPAFGSEDWRRPPLWQRFRQGIARHWFCLRQALRPRARLREWRRTRGWE